MPTLQEVSANKAELKASPRVNPKTGAVADFLKYLKSPKSSQQMQGLMSVLPFVDDLEQVLDDASYGRAPIQGKGMTLNLTPEGKSMVELATIFAPGGRAASQAAESGAMALGRVGEQYAERKVPQIMAQGGRPAQLLSDLARGTVSPATVYHGSPHKFTKFDSSKIGTGEGAQAYGHGLYLAEAKDVAKGYQKATSKDTFLSPNNTVINKNKLIDMGFDKGDANVMLNALRIAGGDFKAAAQAIKSHRKDAAQFLENIGNQGSLNKGNLYQVDLPDEQIAKMLDYDKPVDEAIRSKVSKAAMEKFGSGSTGTSGELLYKELVREFKNAGSANPAIDASEFLRMQGVPGIRYLDQGSRGTSGGEILGVVKDGDSWRARVRVDNRSGVGFDTPTQIVTKSKPYKTKEEAQKWAEQATGQGTSNFVVFPGMEDMLTIEKINDDPMDLILKTLKK